MRAIPQKHRKQIDSDPFYRRCARANHECDGRITIEHAIIYGGRQIAEMWNYIPLCEFHHAVCSHQDGGDLNKEINEWIALNRATDEQLEAISKAIDYKHKRDYLNSKYGDADLLTQLSDSE